jgi:hypothetical protein
LGFLNAQATLIKSIWDTGQVYTQQDAKS